MTRTPRALPQRIEWFEGSRLTHRDLADAIAHEARMLELHVRALHDTWGIAMGLTTAVATGARDVMVQPGLAYGCRGLSLVLYSATTIAAPPPSVAGSLFDLELEAAPALPGCRSPETDCMGTRIPNRDRLCWRAVDDARRCDCDDAGDHVHLGRFVRSAAGTLTGPDNGFRRRVRGLVRPHVVSGLTAPGALTWSQGTSDLVAAIDTSAAGFTTTPVYLATIASPTPWTGALVAPFVSVGQATPTRFNVHVSIAAKAPALVLLFTQLDLVKELSISWTGVENAVGCSGGLSLAGVLLGGSNLGLFP
jgi:hypothetical protein